MDSTNQLQYYYPPPSNIQQQQQQQQQYAWNNPSAGPSYSQMENSLINTNCAQPMLRNSCIDVTRLPQQQQLHQHPFPSTPLPPVYSQLPVQNQQTLCYNPMMNARPLHPLAAGSVGLRCPFFNRTSAPEHQHPSPQMPTYSNIAPYHTSMREPTNTYGFHNQTRCPYIQELRHKFPNNQQQAMSVPTSICPFLNQKSDSKTPVSNATSPPSLFDQAGYVFSRCLYSHHCCTKVPALSAQKMDVFDSRTGSNDIANAVTSIDSAPRGSMAADYDPSERSSSSCSSRNGRKDRRRKKKARKIKKQEKINTASKKDTKVVSYPLLLKSPVVVDPKQLHTTHATLPYCTVISTEKLLESLSKIDCCDASTQTETTQQQSSLNDSCSPLDNAKDFPNNDRLVFVVHLSKENNLAEVTTSTEAIDVVHSN